MFSAEHPLPSLQYPFFQFFGFSPLMLTFVCRGKVYHACERKLTFRSKGTSAGLCYSLELFCSSRLLAQREPQHRQRCPPPTATARSSRPAASRAPV